MHLVDECLCLLQNLGQQRRQLFRVRWLVRARGLGDGCRQAGKASRQKGGRVLGQRGDAGDAGVDAIEERLLRGGGGYARAVAVVSGVILAGQGDAHASVLRFLLAQAFAA